MPRVYRPRNLPDKSCTHRAAEKPAVAVLVAAGPALSATQILGRPHKPVIERMVGRILPTLAEGFKPPVIERMVGRCNSDGETTAVTGQHG